MFIYNVTNKVSWAIQEEWVKWMKEEHIPKVMATGCFYNHRILHLLENDDEDGATYAVQYQARQQSDYEEYLAAHATALRQEALDRWGDQIIAFRTIMKII